jgi:outer membrane lipase/esterase
MTKSKIALSLLSAFSIASAAHAREFSNLFIFGDSLSDAGTLAAAISAPTAYSKFTTNPNNVWNENLGARYGIGVSPVYSTTNYVFTPNATSNNFAVGGARVDLDPGVLPGPLSFMEPSVPSVSAQVTNFLSRGPVDSNALYAVWAGANDAFYQFGGVDSYGLPVKDALTNIQTAALAEAGQIARLQDAGAKNLIVIGMPNISVTPYGVETGPRGMELFDVMTTTFNNTLKNSIAGRNLLYFDSSAALKAIIDDPSRFGLTNTTQTACGGNTSSLGCVPGVTPGSVTAEQAATFLFADYVHPSGTTHSVISDWIYSTLESTGRMSLLSSLPLGSSSAQWRSIDNRMREFQNFSYQGQGFFITGDYDSGSLDSTANTPSASGQSQSVILGYEKAWSDDLFGGVTFGYSNTPVDLGNNSGRITYNQVALSAFASKKYGALYGNVIATAAFLDYSTTRYTQLGIATNYDSGNTSGNQYGIKFQGGYNFGTGSFVHGPLAGVSWEEVTVKGYQENSQNFTAMQFGDQKNQQLRSRLGYQMQGATNLSGFRVLPYAQLTYEYQYLANNRDYTATFVGSNSAMNVQTSNPTGGYGLLAIGGIVEVTKTFSLSIDATTTFGQPSAQNTSVGITLNWQI